MAVGPAASADDGLTIAQQAFARAKAWASVPGFSHVSLDPRNQAERDAADQIVTVGGAPSCQYRVERPYRDLTHFYPQHAALNGISGIVVMRIVFAADGSVAQAQVATAATYDTTFRQAATSVAQQSHLVRLDAASAPGCVLPHAVFRSIDFLAH